MELHTIVNRGGLKVTHRGTEISIVDEVKYLGLILDPRLTFAKHAEYVRKKCISHLKMLGRTRKFVDQDTSLRLYKSLIVPMIDYGDVMYDCLSAKDTYKVQKVQNSVLRIILQTDKWAHITDMHKELNLMYLADRRHTHTIGQVFKCLHGLAPPHVCEQIKMVQHAMTTRSSVANKLEVPVFRLEVSHQAFQYRGPSFWNMLDTDIAAIEG